MNFRTKAHYEYRIAKLKAKGEAVNTNLIRKAVRKLRNMK